MNATKTEKIIFCIIGIVIIGFILYNAFYTKQSTETTEKVTTETTEEVTTENPVSVGVDDTPRTSSITQPAILEKNEEAAEAPVVVENFENVSPYNYAYINGFNMENTNKEPIIKPAIINTDIGLVMDGQRFDPTKPYSSLLTPFEGVYDGIKNPYMIDLGCVNNKSCGSLKYVRTSAGCSSPMYPVPFNMKINPVILKNAKNYVPSPYSGTNVLDNAGYACVPRNDWEILNARGGNAKTVKFD